MTSQLALPLDPPIEVREEDLARERTLGDAIELCAKLKGFTKDKESSVPLGVDKAQFSRWKSGGEGIMWPKFVALMDACNNDAPLLWMLYQRGYDINTLRKRETEIERRLRLVEAERDAERAKRIAGEEMLRNILVGKVA